MITTRFLAAGVFAAAASLAAGGIVPAQAHQQTAAGALSAAERAGSFTVTVSVKGNEPIEGDRVKIKGVVKPAAPGREVRLQVRYEGHKKWKTIDTKKLSSASKYRFKDKVTSVRERKYRVLKPAGPNRRAGHSESVKVTVFGWRPLTSLDPVFDSGIARSTTAAINGTVYPQSLTSYSTAQPPVHIDYNLNHDCKLLEAPQV